MSSKLIRYIGVISNCADSLIGLEIVPGFVVRRWKADEYKERLSEFYKFNTDDRLHDVLFDAFSYADGGDDAYFLVGEIGDDLTENTHHIFADLKARIEKRMALIRLYVNGYVDVQDHYVFEFNPILGKHVARLAEHGETSEFAKWEPLNFEESETAGLMQFIEKYSDGFSHDYIDLAVDNFDLSYFANRLRISYLLLMISLECIFNEGGSEIAYKIARGSALLLSRDRVDFWERFRDMKKMYKRRSDLVHNGNSTDLTEERVNELHEVTRRLILEVIKLNLPKTEFGKHLATSGFSD